VPGSSLIVEVILLLIPGIFNDAFSSVYVILCQILGWLWMATWKRSIFVEELWKTMKGICQDGRSAGWESKSGPLEYGTWMLFTAPWRSVEKLSSEVVVVLLVWGIRPSKYVNGIEKKNNDSDRDHRIGISFVVVVIITILVIIFVLVVTIICCLLSTYPPFWHCCGH
jgi:hypothetical protein